MLSKNVPQNTVENMDKTGQEEMIMEIVTANKLSMQVVKCIPQALRQWWSKALTATLHDWLIAKTTKETLLAIERWSKLKAVVIKPIRSGKKSRSRDVINKWLENLRLPANGKIFGRKHVS